MHEASLMRGLMRKILEVAEAEQASRVTEIEVQLGALSHMSPEHFQEHFDVSSKGTIAEGARIEAVLETDLQSATATEVILRRIEVE